MIKNLISRLRKEEILFNSLLLTFFSLLSTGFAFLVHVVSTRLMTKADYGVFSPLLDLSLLLTLPGEAFRFVSARDTASLKNDEVGLRTYLRSSFVYSTLFGLALAVIIFPSIGFLESFQRVSDPVPFIIIAVSSIFAYPASVLMGGIQGLKMFFLLGFLGAFAAFSRLVLSSLFIYLGFRYNGALLGGMIAFVLSSAWGVWALRKFFWGEIDRSRVMKLTDYFKHMLPAFSTVMLFKILIYIDGPMVKHYFSAEVSGDYGAATRIGKGLLFLLASVNYVVLPSMVHKFNENGHRESLKVLWKGIGIALIMALSFAGFFALFPKYLITIIWGSKYANISKEFVAFTFAYIPFILMYIVVNHYIVIKSFWLAVVFGFGVVGIIGGISLFHSSLMQVILVIGVVGISMFLWFAIHSAVILLKKGDG